MRRPLAAALVGMLATPLVAVAAPVCVGSPARQTADPMSPPCIASFEGNNGGSTAPGVTPTRVEVVLYNDLGIAGDLTQPWTETDEVPGHVGDPTGVTTNLVRTAKALVAHFNARYQTYARVVRVIAYPATDGETPLCAARQSDVQIAINTYQPFAVATVGAIHGCVFNATQQAGILGIGLALFAKDQQVAAPRNAYTFAPTTERNVDASAGFVCRSLAGKPARYAGNPLTGATRRFALVYQSTDQWIADTAVALSVAVGAQCGIVFSPFRSYRSGRPDELASAIVEASRPTLPATAATTVVCICPAPSRDAHLAVATARAIGYQPEWLWLPEARVDRATVLRTLGDPLGTHLGISSTWMAPAPSTQQAFLAARDGDVGLTQPNTVATTDLFVALRLLFTAVQVAGPGLTNSNVATGLMGFAPSFALGEAVPGNFSPAEPRSWTNSYVSWSYDSQGIPPGAGTARGCMRLYKDGVRYTSATWDPNDAELKSGSCTGDLYQQPTDAPLAFATGALDNSG